MALKRSTATASTRENGLDSLITFHGNVNRHKVFDYFKQADIFCAPSLTEASGSALLEAMLYSLPIITINNGGPRLCAPTMALLRSISREKK